MIFLIFSSFVKGRDLYVVATLTKFEIVQSKKEVPSKRKGKKKKRKKKHNNITLYSFVIHTYKILIKFILKVLFFIFIQTFCLKNSKIVVYFLYFVK